MGHNVSNLSIPTLQFMVLRLIATAMLDDSIVSAVQTLDLVFQVGNWCCHIHHLIPCARMLQVTADDACL
jgi:hypothetical protein